MIGFGVYTQGSQSDKRYINVVDCETNEIVKQVDVTGKSERSIGKIEDGLNINLNHNKYYTVIV